MKGSNNFNGEFLISTGGNMAHIAVLFDDDFENEAYIEAIDTFREQGHDITIIGKEPYPQDEETHIIDTKEDEEYQDYVFDALYLPGKYSGEELWDDVDITQFTREFVQSGNPVFAGPDAARLLINAQVLNGRSITGSKYLREEIEKSGGIYMNESVVVDENLVSSRSNDEHHEFIDTCLVFLTRFGQQERMGEGIAE